MAYFRKFPSTVVILLLLLSFTALPATSSVKTADVSITEVGERAFNDLRRCVNTKKVINAFYLVDESSSLKSSDADNLRAKILANSLGELFGLSKDVTVNYAVGFFSTDYQTWRSWTTITSANIKNEKAQLINEVSRRNEGAWTNWQKGIDGAREQLEIQAGKTDGCQTLIWLTDGKLDIEGNQEKNETAYDALCSSTMEILRQSGVSVLGVLLQNENYLDKLSDKDRKETLIEMSKMKPLVEGSGSVGGSNQTCGSFPIPANYTAGGLVVAVDPIGLAFQFAVIAEQIDCGVTEPLPAGASQEFLVEPGIDKVTLITTSKDWSLQEPDGKASNVTGTTTAGVTKISFAVDANQVGNWKLNTQQNSATQIVYCNELGITLDETILVAGIPGIISGEIVSQSNRSVNLSVYKSYELAIQEIYNDGTSSKETLINVTKDNTFALREFMPKQGQSQIQVRVTLRTTTQSGRELAEVSVTKTLDVKLPDEYPRLKENPLKLSEMKGTREPASGVLTFIGSKSSDGKVCFTGTAKILQDVVERKDTWRWTINGSNKLLCIEVPKGQEVEIGIEALNEVTGDSKILAALPIEVSSAGNPAIPLEAVVNFESSKLSLPLWAKIILFILIALLSLLLPVLLIYLIRLATTKLLINDAGNKLARANLKVKITPNGLRSENGAGLIVDGNDFPILSTVGAVRTYVDPTLGEIRTKVPFWFLSREWFEAEAPAGYRIVNPNSFGAGPSKRFKSGQISEVDPNFGKYWALLVAEQDLRTLSETATEVSATLVAFMRPRAEVQNQAQTVINDIALKRDAWVQVKDIAANLNAQVEQPKKAKASPDGGSQIGGKPHVNPVAPQGPGAPPPPPPAGGGAPPPPPPPPPSGGGAPPPPPPPR